MAEVIGITASIAALIQLTGKVTSFSYGYIGGVKRASKDLHELVDELHALSKVLIVLRDYTEQNSGQSTALDTLSGKDSPLQECAGELDKLRAKIEPRDGFKGIIDNLKWPLRESETLQYIARIERHKSLFSFALAADNM